MKKYPHGYTPPTPDEIRGFLKANNLTGAGAARLLKINSRTVRRWTGGDAEMPYSAWKLLQIEMGEL